MRYLISLGIVGLLVSGLAGVKYFQIATLIRFGEAAEASGPPPEAVSTTKATADAWQGELTAIGSVEPVRGVTVSAEVPGVIKAIRFASGVVVKAGQVLVELDSRVERAQLASLQSRLDLAGLNAGRSRRLAAADAVTKAQLDNDEAQLKTLAADVEALKAQIERKTIRAPFAGRVGIRQINLGQYLNAGSEVAVVESMGSVFVDFSVPQQLLGGLEVAMPVRASLAGSPQSEANLGKIAALAPTIDEATRTLKVRAEVPNPKGELRPGMFVNVAVVLPEQKTKLVTVPATAVVHAPYGDSIFIVEAKQGQDGKPANGGQAAIARQQFVRVGATRGDFVAIEEGLKEGQEVVTAGAFKLRNGAPVMVNNSVNLNPSTNPRPSNR